MRTEEAAVRGTAEATAEEGRLEREWKREHTSTTTGSEKQCYLTPDMVRMPLDTPVEELNREYISIIDPLKLFND